MSEAREELISREGERLYKKYRTHMDMIESLPVGKVRTIKSFDHWALGNMLENFEFHKEMCEADGSIGDLGVIPRVALDVITVSYGSSPLSIVCTTQPIDDEKGLVYYKDVKAGSTRGNYTAGETMLGVDSGFNKYPNGYASGTIAEALGTGNDILTNFTGTLANKPIRPGFFSLEAVVDGGATVTAKDDGFGNVLGVGVSGTINYTTGAFDITFATAIDDTEVIAGSYQVLFEESEDSISELNYDFTSKEVTARPYALKGGVGLMKAFGMKKKFGLIADEELAIDLTNGINSEVFGDLVRKMSAACPADSTTEYTVTPPAGTNAYEWTQMFQRYLSKMETQLVNKADRGTISYYVAGLNVCDYIENVPGFQKLYDGNQVSGAHLYGTLKGIPVIRVTKSELLTKGAVDGSNRMIGGFKGNSAFEAAASYNPFMPLTVTTMLPTSNPLKSQRAAATVAATEVLVENFLTEFKLGA